jgi:hypothetical protein
MLHLLKIEWMKVKNYTTFWVLSILYIASVFGANYISFLIYDASTQKTPMAGTMIGTPFNFPNVWHTVSFTSSFLMFMLGLLIIISFTNEYSYKTHRQNIIDGLSRREFIGVKMLLTFIVSFVATITVFAAALLFGLFQSKTDFSADKLEYISYFFVQALSYSSVALLFSLLFKRSGITIGVYFLYSVILENVLARFLNHYTDNTGSYLPLETTDTLIPIPVFRIVVSQLESHRNITLLLMMSAIYLVLYYFISYRKFQSDDL